MARWRKRETISSSFAVKPANSRRERSANPQGDAPVVVAAITGFLLGQLVTPHSDFEDAVFRPALERLFARLVEGDKAAA